MHSRDNSSIRSGPWLTFVIHTALVFAAAPMVFWALICLQNLPFHFGIFLSAAVGLPASYLLFGLPLLAAAAASAAFARWLSSIRLIWFRLGFGAVVGCLLGLALGAFTLRELHGSEAYAVYWSPCPITGGLLGLSFTGIWRLSRSWATAITRRTAEPGAAPNGGPATPLGNSGVPEGPPSVS
jgi:hypothetical protein